MGVFTSAIDGAIEGAQQAVMDNLRTENAVLKRYTNLLADGATFYRALAAGQLIAAARNYGNYNASRDVMKKRYNDLPENDEEFIKFKKKYVTEYAHKKQKMIQEKMAELGMRKVYATSDEIYHDRMDFYTPDEIIADAMIDPPEQSNQNPAPNYVTSPFGSTAPQEEKKKDKGSWFFGKK